MTQAQQIAASIPSEYRVKILTLWLPAAKPDMANEAMQNLFNAYFIYVEPGAEPKSDCMRCVRNVLENWQGLVEVLKEAEKQSNMLNQL